MRHLLNVVAFLLLVGVANVSAASDPNGALHFRRLLVNTGGNATEACLRFDRTLEATATQSYADHLRISPGLVPALRVERTDLCIGNLAFGAHYEVSILAGLTSKSGDRLGQDVSLRVGLGDRPPMVAIAGEGFILPRTPGNGLDIQTVNVRRVRLHVFRLSALAATAPVDDWRVDLTAQTMSGYAFAQLIRSNVSPVWDGTMDIPSQPNRTRQTGFPLQGIVDPGKPGLYLVVAEDAAKAVLDRRLAALGSGPRNDWRDWGDVNLAVHWVDVTGTALTTFSGADGLHVYARSLETALPAAGLHVVLRAAGQDLLGEGTTDVDGGVFFRPGRSAARGPSGRRSSSRPVRTTP